MKVTVMSDIEKELHDMIGNELYPCNAAKGVLARSNMEVCVVSNMASDEAAKTVQSRLEAFGKRGDEGGLISFVVAFEDQPVHCEHHYDALLWGFLQRLHDVDAPLAPWDERVSRDPDSPEFSFSVGGEAYYLIGRNPRRSRMAGRLSVPAIVFNPHRQFEAFRQRGKYDRLRDTIRANDVRYSGSVNPMLQDFGSASEAMQYSGEAHEEGWACPLQIKAA